MIKILLMYIKTNYRTNFTVLTSRYSEAIEVIQTVAKYNGRKIPAHLLVYEKPSQGMELCSLTLIGSE